MTRAAISTVILAGGRGARMGGDKGLQLLRGRTLIDWVLSALAAQSDEVLISANGTMEQYAGFGVRVIADDLPDQAGPLAGLRTALAYARHTYVACVPCDTPFLPADLLSRLYAALEAQGMDAAVAVVEGRRQYAIALYRKEVLPALDVYLHGGQRKLGDWLDSLHVAEVRFTDASAFINVNTRAELARLDGISGAEV